MSELAVFSVYRDKGSDYTTPFLQGGVSPVEHMIHNGGFVWGRFFGFAFASLFFLHGKDSVETETPQGVIRHLISNFLPLKFKSL